MKEISNNIIGFKRDGSLIIFDNRKEYDNYDLKKNNVSRLYAKPKDIFIDLKNNEEKIEQLEQQLDNR